MPTVLTVAGISMVRPHPLISRPTHFYQCLQSWRAYVSAHGHVHVKRNLRAYSLSLCFMQPYKFVICTNVGTGHHSGASLVSCTFHSVTHKCRKYFLVYNQWASICYPCISLLQDDPPWQQGENFWKAVSGLNNWSYRHSNFALMYIAKATLV